MWRWAARGCGRVHEGRGNQGRLLGRGREGPALKAGEELGTDGMSNTLEGNEPEPQSLEGGSVKEMGLGGGQWV